VGHEWERVWGGKGFLGGVLKENTKRLNPGRGEKKRKGDNEEPKKGGQRNGVKTYKKTDSWEHDRKQVGSIRGSMEENRGKGSKTFVHL